MDLTIYKKKTDFRKKEQIKSLLDKLGLPRELYFNDGYNFWNQSLAELEYIFSLCKKLYKQKVTQIHPRKLNDPETAVKELNGLFNEIKKRFNYKLGYKQGKKKVYIRKYRRRNVIENFPLVTCLCGCNQTFYQRNKGSKPRRFFDNKCKNKYHNEKKRHYEQRHC